MMRCLTCEGHLPESSFSKGSPVCKVCVAKLRTEYNVEYSPPERKTTKEATVNLMLAIKQRAVDDDASGNLMRADIKYGSAQKAWYHNWVESEPWSRFWQMMLDTEEHLSVLRSDSRRLHGG